MLTISCPNTYSPERSYICQVMFQEFLGLEHRIENWDSTWWSIQSDDGNSAILLPDILFQTPSERWLTAESLPAQPLSVWDTQNTGIDCPLVHSHIPVIYGDLDFPEKFKPLDKKSIALPLDIFGSAFFMLTRYEEVVKPDRDEHHRFPAQASLAFQEHFLDRPIINEYLEILWFYIQKLTENQKRKIRNFQVVPTHDVDTPFRFLFKTVWQKGRLLAGDLVKRKSLSSCLKNALNIATGNDPLDTFDMIMDISEHAGWKSSFYFMAGGNTGFEGNYPVKHPGVQGIMRSIHERGHHVGFHPSYEAGLDGSIWRNELETLQEAAGVIPLTGGRQHFLRFQTPLTWRFWAESELTYDTTLSFADVAGFRCGICYQFPVFDVEQRVQLDIQERPLIVMECTVIDEQYMNLGATEQALVYMEMLKERCRLFDGEFVLLWHNTRFLESDEVNMFTSLLSPENTSFNINRGSKPQL